MQQVWLFLHVLGAATWFGTNVAVMIMSNRYNKVEGEAAGEFQQTLVALGLRSQTPAAILLLVSGIFLVLGSNDAYQFESGFVVLGFFTIVVGAVLGSRFFGPQAQQAATLHRAGDTKAARAVEARVAKIGTVEVVLLAATIAAMVWRWAA